MCLVRDVERYSRQDPINGGNIEVVYVLPYYEVATPQLFDLSRHLSVPQLRPTRCSAESRRRFPATFSEEDYLECNFRSGKYASVRLDDARLKLPFIRRQAFITSFSQLLGSPTYKNDSFARSTVSCPEQYRISSAYRIPSSQSQMSNLVLEAPYIPRPFPARNFSDCSFFPTYR